MSTRARTPLERDPEAFRNLFRQLTQEFIQPEIEKRRSRGELPDEFRIRKCLILFGSLLNPQVLFNDEAKWTVGIVPDFSENPTVGMDVNYSEIKDIHTVLRPLQNGSSASFAYLYHTMSGYSILLDIIPHEITPEQDTERWKLKVAPQIIEIIKDGISERIILSYNHEKLKQIGLWLAPALLPYPCSKILELLEKSKPDAARLCLLQYCTCALIEKMVREWFCVSVFNARRVLFEEVLWAHINGKYHLSIHALLPQIEGLISDFLHSIPSTKKPPFPPKPKIEKFRDTLLALVKEKSLFGEGIKSSIDFMLEVLLKGFANWLDPVHETLFPIRNAVMHGKYEDSLYTEENSAKLFLALDTLNNYMKLYTKLSA